MGKEQRAGASVYFEHMSSFPLKMHCDILFFKVATMLPGGLQVIGVFAVAPAQMMQSSQAKLRQVSGLTITNLQANAAYNKLIPYFFQKICIDMSCKLRQFSN